jgi:putative ATPase
LERGGIPSPPEALPSAGLKWPPPAGAEIRVSLEAAEESIQRRAVLYDRDGDYHFDTISAFIKSVRGSDPDAALYWLAKMLRAGEDPAFIFRRMIILASEDVGMADPRALQVVISCAEAFDRIGFPEGNFPLAHACLYLATAPKSNSVMAFFDALAQVDKEDAEVPRHLRDANRDAEAFGHGEGYVYPHAYRDHWAAQQYLPQALRGKTFYSPSVSGYEGKIRDEVIRKREIQAAVILGDAGGNAAGAADGELLSWSAGAKGREGWYRRLESGRSALLLADRDRIFEAAAPARQDRVLIPAANDGLLLWESLRRSPEGLSAALVDAEAARDALLRFAGILDGPEQPLIAVKTALPGPEEARELFDTPEFDKILCREIWRRGFGGETSARAFAGFAEKCHALLGPGGRAVILQSPPRLGQRLSALAAGLSPDAAGAAEKLAAAENAFYAEDAWWSWKETDLAAAFSAAGFTAAVETVDQSEERLLSDRDLAAWFDRGRSSWGKFTGALLGTNDFSALYEMLSARAKQGPVSWRWQSLLLTAKKV